MADFTCEECDGKCCKYVAMEIDTPEELEDFEAIKWYVCHKNVNVFVDEDYIWHLEFLTPCEHFGENNKCKIYSKRPKICQEHSHEECLFHNDDYKEKFVFNKIEDVEKYIKEVFEKGEHVIVEDEDEDSD
jgi:uncharacterized protein